MARKAQSDNMLEKMRDQHAQDKVNDRMETGSFPTVRKKPRKDLNPCQQQITVTILDSHRSDVRVVGFRLHEPDQ